MVLRTSTASVKERNDWLLPTEKLASSVYDNTIKMRSSAQEVNLYSTLAQTRIQENCGGDSHEFVCLRCVCEIGISRLYALFCLCYRLRRNCPARAQD